MEKKPGFNLLEASTGLLFILLGMIVILNPETSLVSFIMIISWVIIIKGVMDVIVYMLMRRETPYGSYFSLLSGIGGIFIGFILLTNSKTSSRIAVALFIVWFIVNCFSRLSNAGVLRLYGDIYYYCTVFLYILGIILGIVLLLNTTAAIYVIMYIVGAYLIIFGLINLFLVFLRRKG